MESCHPPVGKQNDTVTAGRRVKPKRDVQQGTLALMVLKTLEVLGPLHGYGIARRIEQISGDVLAVNQGTLYPVLLRLEQEGAVASEWGASENNRRARFYRLTRAGREAAGGGDARLGADGGDHRAILRGEGAGPGMSAVHRLFSRLRQFRARGAWRPAAPGGDRVSHRGGDRGRHPRRDDARGGAAPGPPPLRDGGGGAPGLPRRSAPAVPRRPAPGRALRAARAARVARADRRRRHDARARDRGERGRLRRR